MAELLRTFEDVVSDESGSYIPRVVGRLADDGMWEGWLEFVPVGEGDVLATPVESRQPQRAHLEYWATGLTAVYAEGAVERAKHPPPVTVHVEAPPMTAEPAPRPVHTVSTVPPVPAEPVLDPFEIGSRNLDILRQELTALNRPRLLNIITAYDLNPAGKDLNWMTDAQLITFIVTAVEVVFLQRR